MGHQTAPPTTVYITPQQRKRLFERARKRNTSFSNELRSAVDLYLNLPAGFSQEELEMLATEAKASIERSMARLDAASARLKQAAGRLEEFDRRLDESEQLESGAFVGWVAIPQIDFARV